MNFEKLFNSNILFMKKHLFLLMAIAIATLNMQAQSSSSEYAAGENTTVSPTVFTGLAWAVTTEASSSSTTPWAFSH